MFKRKKKDKAEKERDKLDKKLSKKDKKHEEKMTPDEMRRFQEVYTNYQVPTKDKKGSFRKTFGKGDSADTVSRSSEGSNRNSLISTQSTDSETSLNVEREKLVDGSGRQLPNPPVPKPRTKSILKMKSNYGPVDETEGKVLNLSDSGILAENTIYNERYSDLDGKESFQQTIPELKTPSFSQYPDKYAGLDLKLPPIIPPKPPRTREIILHRQVNGGFGFSLRRSNIEERAPNGSIVKRVIHFAEPSASIKENMTGLLPGDRLIEVNGFNVENVPRDDIIVKIRGSSETVTLKVQPIPELVELSVRSSYEGNEGTPKKSGSLRMSGSLRLARDKAKSDDQLASEKAVIDAEKVWLLHRGGFSAAKLLQSDGNEPVEGRVKIKLEHSGDIIEVDDDDIEKANPPQFDRAEDLGLLPYLNESGVLHTLRQRYASNLIKVLGVLQMFKGCKAEDMPPHIYATAQTAYKNLLTSRMDQSIIFLGQSGSGKSTSAKHVISYLTNAAGSVNNFVTAEKMHAVSTLLEAFGNARTIQNSNATRFAQVTSLDYDYSGQIAAGSVQILMLEKYRVVRRPDDEPTFNVFYHLLAGADTVLKKELHLNQLFDQNYFINYKFTDKQAALNGWNKVQTACQILGFTPDECRALWSVVAAIIHLGAAGAMKGAGSARSQFSRPAEAQKAASVLGTSLEELARNTFNPKLGGTPTRSPLARNLTEGRESPSGDSSNSTAVEALQGMAVGLYQECVNALVSMINKKLSSTYRTVASILVLDSSGFQNPASMGRSEGASFQDLFSNYAQERLQLLFHESTFTSQHDRYAQENIDLGFDEQESTPAAMVQLIDRQQVIRTSAQDGGDPKGLLWLLDEESMYPSASDDSFSDVINLNYDEESKKLDGLIRTGSERYTFVLNHLLGSISVQYNFKNWIKSNRENPSAKMATSLLQDSQKKNISSLFIGMSGSLPATMMGSVAGIEGASSLRRASSIRRAWTSGTAAIKRKSVCLQVKFQADGLLDSIRRTKQHFVQCILPKNDAGLVETRNNSNKSSSPHGFTDLPLDIPLLVAQLKGLEVIEATRLYRQGFPESMMFPEFRRKFDILDVSSEKTEPILDEKKAVEELLQCLDVDATSFRIGLSQIFFRPGSLSRLEEQRDDKLSDIVTELQARCRGIIARRRLKQLKIQRLAVTCVQRNVRKFIKVQAWPWWRLYTKVLPLLDIHRTEEELKMKDIELDQLKNKFERIEKERNIFKENFEKMESKMSEMSADLAEEHATANHATEMLEAETAERLRLEKELKELKAAHSSLQRKMEKMEMEVMEARMVVRTSYMDPDYDSEEEEEDSIYRQKYEKLRREMEMMKKRLQHEHEEESEKQYSIKKSLEKQLVESNRDIDDYKKQIQTLKKKSQKQMQEHQDLHLHLESQQARNNELEKKQRKFDNELHKIQAEGQKERTQRERLQRERDILQSESYHLKQELEDMKSEVSIKESLMDNLQSELNDASKFGGKDEKEVMALKKAKRELEAKVQDQEEELDDQAGEIQQLSQAKLRLEMQNEKMKMAHQKELDAKDEEVESMRSSCQNKLKQLEVQIEEEYSERQSAIREKRDIERQLTELRDHASQGDKDVERRLRKDLKKTKALLSDAQTVLDKQQTSASTSAKIKQLKNELEDTQYTVISAVKARQSIETELADIQSQLDDALRAKSEAEEKVSRLNRENNELQSRIDDQDEDFNELLKKHKAFVFQASSDHARMSEHLQQITELTEQKQQLDEKVTELTNKMEYMGQTMVEKNQVTRLEARVHLEDGKELFGHMERLKESLEAIALEKDQLKQRDHRAQESMKKVQKELRDLREQYSVLQRKEVDASKKKHEFEVDVQNLEETNEQLQSDLKLAFKRIKDLQNALEDEIGTDSDIDDSDVGSDDDTYLRRYSRSYSSSSRQRLSSSSSLDYRHGGLRTSYSEHSGSEESFASKAKYPVNHQSSEEEAIERKSNRRTLDEISDDIPGLSKSNSFKQSTPNSITTRNFSIDSTQDEKVLSPSRLSFELKNGHEDSSHSSETSSSPRVSDILSPRDKKSTRRASRGSPIQGRKKKGLVVNPDYL
ncbi:unconventional myosin-XVIIIa-like [Anneissia japonica]|uniref:unconventional myosin-XVIIIa-like n=1 Tax=Anneissia japonica TaxID=1529436 RepID=UPI0014254C9E|nr:unconventional myosin-XVIIIa-like [Anneissia japonica]